MYNIGMCNPLHRKKEENAKIFYEKCLECNLESEIGEVETNFCGGRLGKKKNCCASYVAAQTFPRSRSTPLLLAT